MRILSEWIVLCEAEIKKWRILPIPWGRLTIVYHINIQTILIKNKGFITSPIWFLQVEVVRENESSVLYMKTNETILVRTQISMFTFYFLFYFSYNKGNLKRPINLRNHYLIKHFSENLKTLLCKDTLNIWHDH